MTAHSRRVHLALGANLGDRLGNLAAALAAIHRLEQTRVERISLAYATDPVGPAQPEYLNAAAIIRTALAPGPLLAALQAIEVSLGRQRRRDERWGPRTIDIDLLLDGESLLDTPGLAVPHPRLAERAFVLIPLAEIDGDAVEPRSGLTIRSLLDRLLTGFPTATRPRVTPMGPIPFVPPASSPL